jgi:hypothetical protein
MSTDEKQKSPLTIYVEQFLKFLVLGLLGIVSYFLQQTNQDYKDQIHAQNLLIQQQGARIDVLQNSLNSLQLNDVTSNQTNVYIQERIRGLELGREENRSRIEQLEKQMIKLTR